MRLREFEVVPVLFVTHTSIRVMLIPVRMLGSCDIAAS